MGHIRIWFITSCGQLSVSTQNLIWPKGPVLQRSTVENSLFSLTRPTFSFQSTDNYLSGWSQHLPQKEIAAVIWMKEDFISNIKSGLCCKAELGVWALKAWLWYSLSWREEYAWARGMGEKRAMPLIQMFIRCHLWQHNDSHRFVKKHACVEWMR